MAEYDESRGELLRAPDGRLYFIPDEQLEQLEVTGEHLEHARDLLENGSDEDGFQLTESSLQVFAVSIPPGWGPFHAYPT